MAMTLITTNTSSNAATSDITSSIDSTYKLYIFKFYDVNPATDDVHFGFQANAASQSGYNETMNTSYIQAYHKEDDSDTPNFVYTTGRDQANGTSFQAITESQGNGGDESAAGTLWLFNPSNTTYVKHFHIRTHGYSGTGSNTAFIAGYFNTTTAIDDVEFKFSTGNFDGTIKMYGVG